MTDRIRYHACVAPVCAGRVPLLSEVCPDCGSWQGPPARAKAPRTPATPVVRLPVPPRPVPGLLGRIRRAWAVLVGEAA